MIEFLLTFIILLVLIAGMAIGVIRGRPPIAGTCGGLNNIGADGACELCGGNPSKCEQESEAPTRSGSFYDGSS